VGNGAERQPHFDGLPVDFVARCIAGIGSEPRAGYATYHVVNARWEDTVSLDTLVDWIQSAGYPVTRIDEYARWYQELGDRLRELPLAQQQHSPLPILYQWAEPIPVDREIRFDASRLRERLAEIEGRPVDRRRSRAVGFSRRALRRPGGHDGGAAGALVTCPR
jgi:fatty acid CoA ligase FadD9